MGIKHDGGNGIDGDDNRFIRITLDARPYYVRIPEGYQVMNFINTLIIDDLWPYNYQQKVVKFMLKNRKQEIDERTTEKLYDSIVHLLPEIELETATTEFKHRLESLIEMTMFETQIEQEKKISYKNLGFHLKSKIFGQEKALDEIINSIHSFEAELIPRESPTTLFLMGPSGVGKTESVKIITYYFGKTILRVDCQDYQQDHEVLRLRGAPPSYIGFDPKGGMLSKYISKNPKGIILFDEIEKAHRNLYDALIGVMDTGEYADPAGNKYQFNGLIFFTSNVGNKYSKQFKKIGFGEANQESLREENIEKEFKETFKTYFAGRLNKKIMFQTLNKDIMRDILVSYKKDVDTHLKKKGITLRLSNNSFDNLLDVGLDPDLGVRHMKSTFNSRIIDLISSHYIKDKTKINYSIDYVEGKYTLI